MRSHRLAWVLIACSLGVIGCPADPDKVDGGTTGKTDGGGVKVDGGVGTIDGGTTDGGTATGDAGVDAGMTLMELTDFAKDLILNHAADRQPTTTEDKTFAADTQDASKFPPAFFQ